jgi:hypothetical protein
VDVRTLQSTPSRRWAAVLVFLSLSFARSLPLGAQAPDRPVAIVQGRVHDQSGIALPGVTVRMLNETIERTSITNDQGTFVVAELPPGEYRLLVVLPGFATTTRTVAVRSGETRQVDIELLISAPQETVKVSGTVGPSVPIRWNAWMEEEPGRRFVPVVQLRPGHRYRLLVDVSSLSYSRDRRYVYSGQVSNHLGNALEEWLDKNPEATDVTLRTLLIPDPRFFEPLDDAARMQPLRVDLERLRAMSSQTADSQVDPFALLRVDAMADFVLGRVSFVIETSTNAPSGRASVALSVWGAGYRPLDEISLSFCIDRSEAPRRPCRSGPIVAETLEGIDAARVALTDEGNTSTAPDAALHFLQLDAGMMVGVFRNNLQRDPTYVTWTLGLNAGQMSAHVKEILTDIAAARAASRLVRPGRELYDLLLPAKAVDARAAFQAFIVMAAARVAAGMPPPSLFVRAVAGSGATSVPTGLMNIRELGVAVGSVARVETPLPIQDYSSGTICLSRWAVALPPPGTRDARLQPALERVSAQPIWQRASVLTRSTAEFEQWAVVRSEDPATFMTVLGHHEHDRLAFDGDRFYGASFNRSFAGGAVILAACGTAGDAPISIMNRLNQNGMTAAIVTNAPVNPTLTGDFLKWLGVALDAVPDEGNSLGELFFNAQRQLRADSEDGQSAYADLALVFSLVGNSNLRVCRPDPGAPK